MWYTGWIGTTQMRGDSNRKPVVDYLKGLIESKDKTENIRRDGIVWCNDRIVSVLTWVEGSLVETKHA